MVSGKHQSHIYDLADVDVEMVSRRSRWGLSSSIWRTVSPIAAGTFRGAWFAVRSRLPESIRNIPEAERTVLTSPHDLLAKLGGEGS